MHLDFHIAHALDAPVGDGLAPDEFDYPSFLVGIHVDLLSCVTWGRDPRGTVELPGDKESLWDESNIQKKGVLCQEEETIHSEL